MKFVNLDFEKTEKSHERFLRKVRYIYPGLDKVIVKYTVKQNKESFETVFNMIYNQYIDDFGYTEGTIKNCASMKMIFDHLFKWSETNEKCGYWNTVSFAFKNMTF